MDLNYAKWDRVVEEVSPRGFREQSASRRQKKYYTRAPLSDFFCSSLSPLAYTLSRPSHMLYAPCSSSDCRYGQAAGREMCVCSLFTRVYSP